jgi:integrase
LQAVREARELRRRIDCGEDPLAERAKQATAAKDTLQAISEEFFKRDGASLRTKDDRERALERLVYPALGSKNISAIKRSDVVWLLDKIEDDHGPVMADRTLAYIRKVMNWHASRSDDFRSPLVRGMARTKPKERARERTLSDDELRAVWKAGMGPYGALVKFVLLSAARRTEAAGMSWDELAGAVWTLPASRNKTKLGLLRPLPEQALAVLPARNGRFVFTTDAETPISGFSKFKAVLDKASGVTGWTLHDCRRTSRTLMSRASVSADIAERCLGHVIGGVRGIYDMYEYMPEKQRAYDALASLVDRIVNPPADNVKELRRVTAG